MLFRSVWFGWFGLVWFGLVWFGLVWFGLVCWRFYFAGAVPDCQASLVSISAEKRAGDCDRYQG